MEKTQRYANIMKKVEDAAVDKIFNLEDNPEEYEFIADCSAFSVEIENEIFIILNYIRDKYSCKFPELESIVRHPTDYARVVKKIGSETDITLVDLQGILPSAIIMAVCVTASTTTGKPIPEDVLQNTIEACDRLLALDASKIKILDFLEKRMGRIAPNLSAVVGSSVAAKLVAAAGGLSALANMPDCNVRHLGAKKNNLAGFSTATSWSRVGGYIEETEIFQTTPPPLRSRARRLLASKSIYATRIDSAGRDPTGNTGRRILQEEILKKIDKWQERPPAKQPKPLPVPVFEPKKKRGGRRLRKKKERYALSKLANRIAFGVAEDSSLGDGLGEGYGMLGKLRVAVGQSKLAAKAAKKFKNEQFGRSGGGAISGLTSSLAFTVHGGIELTNPQAHGQHVGGRWTSTYFSDT